MKKTKLYKFKTVKRNPGGGQLLSLPCSNCGRLIKPGEITYLADDDSLVNFDKGSDNAIDNRFFCSKLCYKIYRLKE